MEQSPSWKTHRFSASQEITRILWNPKVHYLIHEYLPPAHTTQTPGILYICFELNNVYKNNNNQFAFGI